MKPWFGRAFASIGAGVMDVLDGLVARLLNARSEIGKQIGFPCRCRVVRSIAGRHDIPVHCHQSRECISLTWSSGLLQTYFTALWHCSSRVAAAPRLANFNLEESSHYFKDANTGCSSADRLVSNDPGVAVPFEHVQAQLAVDLWSHCGAPRLGMAPVSDGSLAIQRHFLPGTLSASGGVDADAYAHDLVEIQGSPMGEEQVDILLIHLVDHRLDTVSSSLTSFGCQSSMNTSITLPFQLLGSAMWFCPRFMQPLATQKNALSKSNEIHSGNRHHALKEPPRPTGKSSDRLDEKPGIGRDQQRAHWKAHHLGSGS